MNKLRIAIDYDDVLAVCTAYALQLEKEKTGVELDYNSVDRWGKTGRPTDVIFKYFGEEEFYKTQPLYKGAQEFIKTLVEMGHDVVILTAVDLKFAAIRAKKILSEFPEIKPENIILTNRKDLVHVDVLLDDAPHNLHKTPARYPICFRRPWNSELTGLMSVFSYDEALNFINRVSSINYTRDTVNKIYALVGPSGSGKTAITEELIKDPRFSQIRSTTTRTRRSGESETAYNFVTKDQFEQMVKENRFIETTIYAGHRYGTTKDEIEKILGNGMNAVIPMDISGANALKMEYQDQCVTVYVKRPKDLIIQSLIDRMVDQIKNHPERTDEIKKDIQNRILSLNSEKRNQEICDRIILNNGSIADVVKEFL